MENIKRVTLRLPIDLYNRIKRLAEQEKRSIHSQVVYMLESYLASKSKG